MSDKLILNEIDASVSDHYLVAMNISRPIEVRNLKGRNSETCDIVPKFNWTKLDKDLYSNTIGDILNEANLTSENIDMKLETEDVAIKTCQVMNEAALKYLPSKTLKPHNSKPKQSMDT